jgi:hypothetical protein
VPARDLSTEPIIIQVYFWTSQLSKAAKCQNGLGWFSLREEEGGREWLLWRNCWGPGASYWDFISSSWCLLDKTLVWVIF